MKLTPIEVEAALSQSVGTATAPNQGPIESALRAALARLGEDGCYWVKGHERLLVPERWVRTPVLRSTDMHFDPTVVYELTYSDHVIPEGVAYCTIGALVAQVGFQKTADICGFFHKVTGINNIVLWNDSLNTCWLDVKIAFEKAISCAKEQRI